jgi:hypothetical protein
MTGGGGAISNPFCFVTGSSIPLIQVLINLIQNLLSGGFLYSRFSAEAAGLGKAPNGGPLTV